MAVRDLVHLCNHCSLDTVIAMAQTRNRSASSSIKYSLPVAQLQVASEATDDLERIMMQASVKDSTFGR